MVKKIIASKNHLKEVVVRNPELLEKDLKIVDTDIEIFAGDYIDMLALDRKNRLVVLVFSDKPQSLRTNKGVHVLKEAFHDWNWLTYFKDGLLEGAEKRVGIRPVPIPPRLIVIAPSLTKSFINLAKKANRSLIDLRIYTYSKDSFNTEKKPFHRISLKSDQPPAPLPKSIGDYHAQKMDEYFYKYGPEFVDIREGKGYEPYALENHQKLVGSDFEESFQKFAQNIESLGYNLRPVVRVDAIGYKDVYGNEVCSLSVHGGKGFSLLVEKKLFYWGEKSNQEQEEQTALAEIKSYAKSLQKKAEKAL